MGDQGSAAPASHGAAARRTGRVQVEGATLLKRWCATGGGRLRGFNLNTEFGEKGVVLLREVFSNLF